MAQLFHARFGFLFRLGALLLFALVAAGIVIWRESMSYPVEVNDAVEQVVPFSHKHHVGQDGIDCRYCHTAVEQSAFAGIPPLSTCMTCHSQLFTDQPVLQPLIKAFDTGIPLHWQRVYKLPDFVYFNHSIHVAKGIGCATCHGAVDTMPLTRKVQALTMQWCLACHRAPQKFLRPRNEVFNLHWHAQNQLALGARLVRAYHIDTRRLTDCSICHR